MAYVAAVQMVSSANLDYNLSQLDTFFMQACESGVELLVLPENFAFMGMNDADKYHLAEDEGQGKIQQTISQLALRYGIWVIAGTIPIKYTASRVKAASMVYDNKGVLVARYDKIHLFDVRVSEHEAHQESLTVEPGERIVLVDTPVGRVGLSVCYDLRFPELYRQLAIQGAEIFVVPSAFTAVTGAAHWEVLLRARAIENLCYVLAPNQGGHHENGRYTYGHSMIIEPWGAVIAEELGQDKQGGGIIVADIDLHRLTQLRRQFPCHEHHVLHSGKVPL